MKHFVTLPYLLSMYLTSSGRGFLPLVSWDQAVTSVYIVLTAACSIQEKEEECMIHIRVLSTNGDFFWNITAIYINVRRSGWRLEVSSTLRDGSYIQFCGRQWAIAVSEYQSYPYVYWKKFNASQLPLI